MLPILFEDNDIIAIDKPEGLPVIPEQVPGDTVISRVAAHLSDKVYVIHRLDKDTSGVLLLAKNPASHQMLNDQFSERQIRKTYLCLLHGTITADEGRVSAPIRQFGSGRMGVDRRRGKPSQTEFRVLKRFRKYTLVEAAPLTGRRHQLRVHFYHIGNPIVGDRHYGDRKLQRAFARLMLHAQSISFRLPSGADIIVTAPVAASFEQALAKIVPPAPVRKTRRRRT